MRMKSAKSAFRLPHTASKRQPSTATQSETSVSGSANTTVVNTAPNGRMKAKSRLDRKDTVDQVSDIPESESITYLLFPP